MKRTVIYTASFGGHDEPPELWGAGCDLICYTDSPTLKRKTWRVQRLARLPLAFTHPRLKAKWFKMNAVTLHRLSYKTSIWIDAAFWVHHGEGFAEHCLRHLHDGMAFYPHPAEFRSLEQESAISAQMRKYDGEPLIEQVQHYRRQGFEGGRLLCGGVIARVHTPKIARLEKRWLKECQTWSTQDQLSLPYVLHRAKITPGLIPGDIYSNPYLAHLWSGTQR